MADADFVDYEIFLKATQAIEELRRLSAEVSTFQERLTLAKEAVRKFSMDTGMSMRNTANNFAQLDEDIAKATKTSTVFGSESKAGWNQAGQAAETNANRMVRGINLINTALRVLEGILVYGAFQAVVNFFGNAIKQARQLEDTLYRLGNVEKSLSMEGINISLKGMEDGITRIQKKLPIFSRNDVSQLVGTLAISTKQLGLTEKQILDLAQAVAVLNVRSEKQEDLSTTASHVLSSILTGNARGITQLGIAFTDNVMKAKAMELGFLKAGEAVSTLSENEKGITKLGIILDSTNQELGSLNDYLDTNTAKILVNKAAWEDLLATVGQGINNLIPNIAPVLEKLQESLEVGKVKKLFGGAFGSANDILNGGFAKTPLDTLISTKLYLGIKLTTDEYKRLKEVLESLPEDKIKKLFPDPSQIKDRFTRELIESLITLQDTATSSVNKTNDALSSLGEGFPEASQKMKDGLDDLAKDIQDKLADLERQYSQKRMDIATNYSDKIADINRKASQKRADAETDLGNKLADINRDTNEKISEAQQDYRQKEIDREQEKNDKLKDLQRKFLMDLEDALRERDARAVLKLIRNYNAEKKAAEEANKQQAQQNKVELARKLQDIEIEKQQKIDAARREYADKLKEIQLAQEREAAEAATAKRRELRDAATWHQRQLEEQRIYLQRKLRDLADAISKEYQLTAAGTASIYRLMQSYFGASGSLLSGFNSSLRNPLSGGVSTGGTTSGFGTYNSGFGTHSTSTTSYNPYDIRARGSGFAEGGTLLATRPTTVTFGETPEIATFTPITRTGQNMNDLVVSSGKGGGASGGKADIVLKLSPDLQAEIMESSLENMAVHIERLVRNT